MKDILGRTLKDGDIVVVKGNGSYGYSSYKKQKGMEVGIVYKNSVRTVTGIRNPNDKFLVENPGEKELLIKQTILDAMEIKDITKRRVSKQKANEIGGIYKFNLRKPSYCLYMGYGILQVEKNGIIEDTFEGHYYINVGTQESRLHEDIQDVIDGDFKYYYNDDSRILKSYRNVIEQVDKRDDIPEKLESHQAKTTSRFSGGRGGGFVETTDYYNFYFTRT